MTILKLLAPIDGWACSLTEVPDEVFAASMLGPGVAIDPTGDTLFSPCAGQVISVAPSRHAVAVRADSGIEILLHVGIDTVNMKGEGFGLLTEVGARVAAGAPLLKLDLDLLARRAKSLLTPIVVTNAERFRVETQQTDRSVTVGDVLLEISAREDLAPQESPGQAVYREAIVLPTGNGLHARPAAVIAQRMRSYSAEVQLEAHGRVANVRSPVAVMALGARGGDTVTVAASGVQALAAVRALRELIPTLHEAPPVAAPVARVSSPPSEHGRLRGVIASRGLAVGRAVTMRAPQIVVEEAGQGVAQESAALERARAQVRARLEILARRASVTARDVLNAHLEFLDDWELVAAARRTIARGKSAGYAWRHAVRESAETLRSLNDARMTERVDDLYDLEAQVLHALRGSVVDVAMQLPDRAILLADELQPSQMVALDATRLAGICLGAGGPTSHVAILAAAMGIPALVALGPGLADIDDGAWLVLDAEQGVLTVSPDRTALASAEQTLALRRERKLAEQGAAQHEARTADGARIEVFANLGSVAEAQIAVAQGAEGCGLLRTEFLFLDRDLPPSEDEQLAPYQAIATALGGRPLIVRTLDVGGDKPLAYLPLPPEDNPALGLRGVRTGLWRPDVLRQQLRAVLRVQPAGQCRLLLPMVTDATEIRAVRRMVDEVRRELGNVPRIDVGAMIETPAAALNAAAIAREAEFLSIGTNDLTQYTLAMDRGHAELAHRVDGLHPAVLRLIAMTTDAAQKFSRLTAVCGGLASDPLAVPLLLGLGVRELSVVPAMIPQLKALIRMLTLEACALLAQRALELGTAEEVRGLVAEFAAAERQVTP
jgi:phosphocarrier protein FPr/phosphocarrier protein